MKVRSYGRDIRWLTRQCLHQSITLAGRPSVHSIWKGASKTDSSELSMISGHVRIDRNCVQQISGTAGGDPDSQQVQLPAAVHLPLDQLQPVDVTFGSSVAPGQFDRGLHFRPGSLQPFGKSMHLLG